MRKQGAPGGCTAATASRAVATSVSIACFDFGPSCGGAARTPVSGDGAAGGADPGGSKVTSVSPAVTCAMPVAPGWPTLASAASSNTCIRLTVCSLKP